jgi:hypothetical protein
LRFFGQNVKGEVDAHKAIDFTKLQRSSKREVPWLSGAALNGKDDLELHAIVKAIHAVDAGKDWKQAKLAFGEVPVPQRKAA